MSVTLTDLRLGVAFEPGFDHVVALFERSAPFALCFEFAVDIDAGVVRSGDMGAGEVAAEHGSERRCLAVVDVERGFVGVVQVLGDLECVALF